MSLKISFLISSRTVVEVNIYSCAGIFVSVCLPIESWASQEKNSWK